VGAFAVGKVRFATGVRQRDRGVIALRPRLAAKRASLLDHWSGLTLFVDDPRIPKDNNASERTVRGPAMGRKNDYGSDSLWSVCLTAAMFSMVATLKPWNVNPRRWLSWYLESCAAAGSRVPEDVQLPFRGSAFHFLRISSPLVSQARYLVAGTPRSLRIRRCSADSSVTKTVGASSSLWSV